MRFYRTLGMRTTPLNRIKNNSTFGFLGLMFQNIPVMTSHLCQSFYRRPYKNAFFLAASFVSFYCLEQYTNANQTATHRIHPPFLRSFPEKKENDPFMTYPALTTADITDPVYIDMLETYLRTFFSKFKPDLFPISEILSWITNPQTPNKADALKYYILEGCDASITPRFCALNGGIRQVASQFNLGESPGPRLTHPKEFQFDHTQGPTEQNTSKVAALLRWICRNESDGMSTLQAYETFSQLFAYQHGYLTPRLNCEERGLAFLKKHIEEIKLNVQRVRIDGSDQMAIQVLNAGLALGPYDADRDKRTTEGNKAINQMSELLLTAQFKATAAVAIKEARQNPSKRIPVIFTPVGGGVFGNAPNAIKSALGAACDLIAQSGIKNIDVCLSAYQPGEADLFKSAHFANAPVLDQDRLSQLQRLSDNASMQPGLLLQMS